MGMGKFLRLYFDGYALPSLTPQNRVAPVVTGVTLTLILAVVLVPKIGEIIGGSQRKERLEVLEK